MPQMKLLLDTNIVIDYLNARDPHYEKARLLMIAGRVGEFSLWLSSSQMTDLVYILSEGGASSRIPSALERLRGLRTFVNIHAVSEGEVDRMLTSSWKDPEDALLFEAALTLKADAIITRNKTDFESSLVKTMDCRELFDWLRTERGLDYAEMAL